MIVTPIRGTGFGLRPAPATPDPTGGAGWPAPVGRGSVLQIGPGDTVGVVAPGFAVNHAALRTGLARLEALGFAVRLGRHARDRRGYLAGDDRARLADLNAMLRDRSVRAVWFARGGYGTARLLAGVDWNALRRAPKLLIGYSDLTALFARALRSPRQICLYGPVVAELGQAASHHVGSLRAGLAGTPQRLTLRPSQVLVAGRAAGRLAGGNLAVLSHLCGTPYAPDLRERVLFLEETGEEAYRIDRMLTQLRQAGWLDRLAGVLLGRFGVVPRRRFPPDRPLREVLRETFGGLGVPVVAALPAGHVSRKRTLPLGARVRLDTRRRLLEFTP